MSRARISSSPVLASAAKIDAAANSVTPMSTMSRRP